MRDDNADGRKSIDNQKRVRQQGDFCKNGAEEQGRKSFVVRVIVLSKNVAGCTIADDEFEECKKDGIKAGTHDTHGTGADKYREESLDEGPSFGSAWFYEN